MQKQVQPQISKGIAPETVFADLKISMLKPIHTKWVTQYYNRIRTDDEILKNGLHRSGISKAIKENICKEDPLY